MLREWAILTVALPTGLVSPNAHTG